MSGNQVGRRTPDAGRQTAEKAKIICPPPSGVDIIIYLNSAQYHVYYRTESATSPISTAQV